MLVFTSSTCPPALTKLSEDVLNTNVSKVRFYTTEHAQTSKIENTPRRYPMILFAGTRTKCRAQRGGRKNGVLPPRHKIDASIGKRVRGVALLGSKFTGTHRLSPGTPHLSQQSSVSPVANMTNHNVLNQNFSKKSAYVQHWRDKVPEDLVSYSGKHDAGNSATE